MMGSDGLDLLFGKSSEWIRGGDRNETGLTFDNPQLVVAEVE